MENNKLIAEFMELEVVTKYNPKEYYVKKYNSGEWHLPEEMKYHESWDWLIPVVQKCYKIDNEENFNTLVDAVSTLDIESTYKAVVKFIKKLKK